MTNNVKVCSTSSISDLSDDLVLKILSFLSVKHVVMTSLLSKKWRYLWTRVPRLEFNDYDIYLNNPDRVGILIKQSLFAHRSHVLQTLCFKILGFTDIGPFIKTALHHHHHSHLCELEIYVGFINIQLPPELFTCKTLDLLKLKGPGISVAEPLTTVSLPSLKTLHIDHLGLFDFGSLQILLSSCNSLTDLEVTIESGFCFIEYDVSWCKTLVSLKLVGFKNVIIGVSSSAVCLPFLKTLHVTRMVSFNNESICRLLSNCPALSDLTLEEASIGVILNLGIAMPFLRTVLIVTEAKVSTHVCSLLDNCVPKLVIIAPSFKYFNFQEYYSSYCIRFYVNVSSKFEDASRAGPMLSDV